MRKKIVIAVGGTGGHVLPAQKIGAKFKEEYDVIYMGVGLSKNAFFKREENCFHDIDGAGLGKGIIHCAIKNLKGLRKAKQILRQLRPEYVIGFGSFHSFPALAAAAYLGIPYDLYEFNVVPGKVNRLFSRGARNVFIHFEPRHKKLHGKLTYIDYAFEEVTKVSKEEALAHFGLDSTKKTLLAFGGSQGALAINQLIQEAAPYLKDQFQLLHFPGKEMGLQGIYNAMEMKAHVEPFCNRMDLAWIAADLAICRAGAGALRELLIYETPALLIPYPEAKDDHQTINAKYIEEIGAGSCLHQSSLSTHLFVNQVFESIEKSHIMRESILSHKKLSSAFENSK